MDLYRHLPAGVKELVEVIDFKRFFEYFILCNAVDDSFALL